MIRNRLMNQFANEYEGSCIKNKKKFWVFKYNGPHNYKIINIKKFMSCNDDFEVTVKCRLCGCESTRRFVRYNELLKAGFSSKFIDEKCSDSWFGVWENEITDHLMNQKIND